MNCGGISRVGDGLRALRRAGMLETPIGRRPGAVRPYGRIFVPAIAAPVRIIVPEGHFILNLRIVCASKRRQPLGLVTTMVGAHAMASHACARRVKDWAPLGHSAADLRRFVGLRKGSSWTKRVNDLCDLGLLDRREQLWVAPPHEWMTTWRAMRDR